MSDAKFRWFDAMNHDTHIPLGLRGVLGYCGIRYARDPDFMVKVRQQTIADHLGVHVNTVKAAFAAGRRRGWLQKTGERQRGRGHHEADTHTLSKPAEMGTATCTHSDVNRYTEPPEYVQQDVPNSRKYVHETAEIGTSANAPTSENDVPKGLDTGFSKKKRVLDAGIAHASARADADVNEISDAPIYDGEVEIINDAEYQAIRRRREAEKRSDADPQGLGDIFGSLFGRSPEAKKTARTTTT